MILHPKLRQKIIRRSFCVLISPVDYAKEDCTPLLTMQQRFLVCSPAVIAHGAGKLGCAETRNMSQHADEATVSLSAQRG